MQIENWIQPNCSEATMRLNTDYITSTQLEEIKRYIKEECEDSWNISNVNLPDNILELDTYMDNGELHKKLRELNLPLKAIDLDEGDDDDEIL